MCVYVHTYTHLEHTQAYTCIYFSNMYTYTEVINKTHVHLKGIQFIIYSHEILKSITFYLCRSMEFKAQFSEF